MLKHLVLLAPFAVALPAAADCREPPDFTAWCAGTASTAVVVDAVAGTSTSGVDLVVRRMFGAPIEGVALDEVLPLDCAATSPQCGLAMPAVMLLSSSTAFTTSQPMVGTLEVRFANATDPVLLETAVEHAFLGDPSLCVEVMYGATNTEHSEDFYEDCEEDSCDDGPFGLALVTGVGLRRLRRRPRASKP